MKVYKNIPIQRIVTCLRGEEFKRIKPDVVKQVPELGNRAFSNINILKRVFSTLKTQKVKEVNLAYDNAGVRVSAEGHSWEYYFNSVGGDNAKV